MIIDGNKIKHIFLGNNRESILKGIKESGFDKKNEFLEDLFGGTFDSSISVGSIDYSPDQKNCVITRGDVKYTIFQGKILIEQGHKLTQFTIDEHGYTKYYISKSGHYFDTRITKTTEMGEMEVEFSSTTKDKECWDNLDLKSINDISEYFKYLQENIFNNLAEGKIGIRPLRSVRAKGKFFSDAEFNFDQDDYTKSLTKFLDTARTLLTDNQFKGVIESLSKIDPERVKPIMDNLANNSKLNLGDSWNKLTTSTRVAENSLKQK